MSTRAYRIIRITTSKRPSFNLSDDDELMEFLESRTETLADNGVMNVGVMALEEAADKFPAHRKALLADIKTAKKREDDYVQYLCY